MKYTSSDNWRIQKKIMDQFSLENKVAIVTGAGQGIHRQGDNFDVCKSRSGIGGGRY